MGRGWKGSGILGALLFLLVSCNAFSAQDARYVRLTILHTNDTHSHLLPFSYPGIVKADGKVVDLPEHRDIGGIARRATLIKQIKAARGSDVLVVDAGDIIDGSPFSVEFKGEAEVAAMNACGYDVMTTGNHEYNNTMEDFLKRKSEAKFPVLAANVFLKSDGSPLLTPYIIKTEDGLRVAILGITVPLGYPTPMSPLVTMKDAIETAKEWVPKLRSQADAVILLDHIGFAEDKELASKVPGIDAIIGGHSHTRMEKPVLVKTDNGLHAFWVGGTVVAQDFQWGGDLGCVDLIFHKGDSGWTLMSYDGKLIPITNKIAEDPQVHAVLEKYHRKIAAKYDRILCQASDDFYTDASYNLLSDVLLKVYETDFSMHNYGGVRTDLIKGPITFADIAGWFPFNNTVVTFQATGAEIKSLLLSQTPAVGGMKSLFSNGKLISAEIGGRPIEDTRVYSGVTTSFFAAGAFAKSIKQTDTGMNVCDAVSKCLEDAKVISPDNEVRAEF